MLEVGAGTGNNTARLMALGQHTGWTCLEPDAALAAALRDRVGPLGVQAAVGTLQDLAPGDAYDTLVYADVLEHIEDDRGEVAEAVRRLRPGGRLVVLSPAHQALFSPFDDSVGHFRRYSARSIAALTPPGARLATVRYLDAVGLAASLAQRAVLRQAMPTAAQIQTWDRWMVPLSRRLDAVLGHRLGKSVLAMWER